MGTSLEGSDDRHLDEKHELHAVSVREVDTAAELASGEQDALDPEEALRVRWVVSFPRDSPSYSRRIEENR